MSTSTYTNTRPARFDAGSRVLVAADQHPQFGRRGVVLADEGGPRIDVRLDGATFATVIARSALVPTTR